MAVRPAVRSHEIVVAVHPGVDDEQVVPLDELVVAVRDGRFSVRWSRTGAEVTVCAGHMLNTHQAPEVCRFLTDVGKDGQAQLGSFEWGPASGFPFVPRVEVGRTVLSLARWNVAAAMRTGELLSEDRAEFDASIGTWRARWKVPRHVYMSEGDNRLLLDLDDDVHVEELRLECRRVSAGGHLVVEEVLPGFDELWLQGPGGRYFCELVIPLVRRPAPATAPAPVVAQPASMSRLRPPGSDWLYAKIYVPRALVEDVLVDELAPFATDTVARGLADSWFFVRYSDPDPHVRLRFRGEPQALVGTLLPELCTWAKALVDRGICLRFGFDTYEREVERFGGEEGAALAEAVFAVDSTAALDLLRVVREGTVDMDRTVVAVLAVDNLLAGLGLDRPARARWYRETVTWGPEVGAEYRRRKAGLRAAVAPGLGLPGGAALRAILDAALHGLAPLGRAFQAAHLPGAVYRSLVHLQCNRLLGTSRADEHLALGLALRTSEGLEHHTPTDW